MSSLKKSNVSNLMTPGLRTPANHVVPLSAGINSQQRLRLPLPSTVTKSENRTSVVGRRTDVPPSAKKDIKLTSKADQNAVLGKIAKFYFAHCAMTGSIKSFAIKSSPEYNIVFEKLVQIMIPEFKLEPASTATIPIPDAIAKLYEAFGYPHCQKKHLAQVYLNHNWPTALPALNFIKERADLFISTDRNGRDCCPKLLDHTDADRLLFRFMFDSLQPQEDPELLQMLEVDLAATLELDDYEELSAERDALLQDIENLKVETAHLKDIQQEKTIREKEVQDCETYCREYEAKRAKIENHLKEIGDERFNLECVLREKAAVLDDLQLQIRNQEISVRDFHLIKTEKNELELNRRHLESQLIELQSEYDVLMMDQAKNVGRLESETSACNKLARQLDLVPCSAPLSKGVNFELPAHGSNIKDLLPIYADVFKNIVSRTGENATKLNADDLHIREKSEELKELHETSVGRQKEMEALQMRLDQEMSNFDNRKKRCVEVCRNGGDFLHQLEFKQSQLQAKNEPGADSAIKKAVREKLRELELASNYLKETMENNEKEVSEYQQRLNESLAIAVEHFSVLGGMETEFLETVERLTGENNALMTEFLNL